VEISENIRSNSLSLYDKTIKRASSCPNSNIMSIEAQLNSTYITVFIISIYVTMSNSVGLIDQEFNPLAGVRNFSHPKYIQMGYRSAQPPAGAASPGVKWLEHKADHSHYLLQRSRMSGPTMPLSHTVAYRGGCLGGSNPPPPEIPKF
jgi:hypothetical protein